MRKYLLLAVLALVGFYVAWPAWSAYRIYASLEEGNSDRLAGKVDFASVRGRLKPMVAAEVERQFDKHFKGDIATQILGAGLKKQLGPQITQAVLENLVKPDILIRAYQRRGDMKELLDLILIEEIGKASKTPVRKSELDPRSILGELKTPATPAVQRTAAPVTETQSQSPARSFGLGNIKGFGLSGPLEYRFGYARDAAAQAPEVDVIMTFTGFDWRLTGLTPRLP